MSAVTTLETGRYAAIRETVWTNTELFKNEPRVEIEAPASGTRTKAARQFGPELATVRLVVDADDEIDTSIIAREFPTISIERAERANRGELTIDDFAWRGAFDSTCFDDAIEHNRPVSVIAVRGSDAVGVAREVLARFQRLVLRRNEESSSLLFDAVLDAHVMLFDPSQEHGRAEHEHALDTWQWMLRLDPAADLASQLAALLHDIDRLGGEAHDRIEHRVHRALDDAHAKRGGERALAVLRGVGVDEATAERVRDLVAGRLTTDSAAALLDDADALSFLSLGSARYADHFGQAQTRRKVSFILGRLSPAAREKVSVFRLRPDIDRLVQAG